MSHSTGCCRCLDDLIRRHPEIDLRINADAAVHDLVQGDFDAAIRYGDGNWPGLNCERLFEGWDVVVAAPSILEQVSIQAPPGSNQTALDFG